VKEVEYARTGASQATLKDLQAKVNQVLNDPTLNQAKPQTLDEFARVVLFVGHERPRNVSWNREMTLAYLKDHKADLLDDILSRCVEGDFGVCSKSHLKEAIAWFEKLLSDQPIP